MKNQKIINYAHRGASEYMPENTMISFNVGIFMGANGIETDVQITKDKVAVLFHDDTLERVTGEKGAISDYTYKELQEFFVIKNDFCDKILSLEDFLKTFYFREITFAIELKDEKAAEITCDLIKKYGMDEKVIITSFKYHALRTVRNYAPHLKTGYLTEEVTDNILEEMKADGIMQLCPKADIITEELVKLWHEKGFDVRAWGVSSEKLMEHAVKCGVGGMTVNFPDKLYKYLQKDI